MTVFSKLEGSAMDTNFYITARSSKFPLDYAHSREDAAALLARHRDRYPDAVVESTNAYFERTRAETLASFPLSRITQRFYDAMLGVLPPQYIKGVAGFFLSEAATQNIHAQFIVHGGCTYGGYADLARESRKIWTIADVLELESRAGARTLTFDWFPGD